MKSGIWGLIGLFMCASCITATSQPSWQSPSPTVPFPFLTDTTVPSPFVTLKPTRTSTPDLPSTTETEVLPIPTNVFRRRGRIEACPECILIVVREDQITFEPPPIGFIFAWGYNPSTGKLAYSTQDSLGGLRDLWVYNYGTGISEEWNNSILQAAWSPTIDPGSKQQYLGMIQTDGKLLIAVAHDQATLLEKDVEPFLVWSPDGERLAYIKNGVLFVRSITSGDEIEIAKQVSFDVAPVPTWSPDGKWLVYNQDNGVFIRSMENGDIHRVGETANQISDMMNGRPLWVLEQQVLVFGENPLKIMPLDGSGAFMPLTTYGKAPIAGPFHNLLWSEVCSCLVGDTEDYYGGPVLVIYEFTQDMRTILDTTTIKDAKIETWWLEGESILLANGKILAFKDFTPDPTPAPTPTPMPCESYESPTINPSKTPDKPLDHTSPESLLIWLKYALANQDISVLCNLIWDRVTFGLTESEYDSFFWQAEFIQQLQQHLSSQTTCMAYTFNRGEESTGLMMFTYGWEPAWEYRGRISKGLILIFSDQWSKGEGMYLIIAAVPEDYAKDYLDQFYEQRCP